MPIRTTVSIALIVSPGLLFSAACSDEADSPGETVQVPAIEGAVQADQFCAIYDKLHCIANSSCCSIDSEKYESVEACEAASPCPAILKKTLDSVQLSSGTLAYDASAAGDYLRQMASAVASCSSLTLSDVTMLNRLTFMQGTREQGAECSPDGTDGIDTLTCKPGLKCALSMAGETNKGTCVAEEMGEAKKVDGAACEESRECQSSRCDETAAACAPKLSAGRACQYADDCESGWCNDCVCATVADGLFCGVKETQPPPVNASGVPSTITVWANPATGAGTSSTLNLQYWDANNGRYSCTTTSGVQEGRSVSCTARAIDPKWRSIKENYGVVGLVSNINDGMLVEELCVLYTTGSRLCYTTFVDSSSIDSVDCSFGIDCTSFWIDNDDRSRCPTGRLRITNEASAVAGSTTYVYCSQ